MQPLIDRSEGAVSARAKAGSTKQRKERGRPGQISNKQVEQYMQQVCGWGCVVVVVGC